MLNVVVGVLHVAQIDNIRANRLEQYVGRRRYLNNSQISRDDHLIFEREYWGPR